ncbi:PREDICTED: uncharacterized protein LOC109184133 isoform X1 [Ipomoea nil]|uniref:uncharacterized protein LOC109184133 isoform X1 n=1 Tax=Ipomoea nil TaxID=35883 RepID=UPI000900DDA2|nr:PREDICTED: uncharacterized protein LOC109184133 isoform X1 [Ipomoea nil]
MGDFNDILSPDEKRGGNHQPRRLIEGFSDVVECSGLSDFPFQVHQFTWERSKGTANWVEAKLDRILVSDSWRDSFSQAMASSIIATKSDHSPLHLQLLTPDIPTPKGRFRFENMWLRDSICREIMIQSWARSRGYHLLDRIGTCGKVIWNWRKNFAKDFNGRISFWKCRMEITKHQRDAEGISMFREAQHQYLYSLRQQNDYWRQRAKQFWLKEGDTHSTYFHNSVRRRRQNNRIDRLKGEYGTWVDKEVKQHDRIIWVKDDKGVYTVKSCYQKLQGTFLTDQIPFRTKAWKLKLPPKIKTFFWQLCSSTLPTVDLLRLRRVQVSPICQLCSSAEESAFHLFVKCPLAISCWDHIGCVTHLGRSSLMGWLEINFKSLSANDLCLMITVCWKIWSARNGKIWNHTITPMQAIINEAHVFLFDWQNVNSSTPQAGNSSAEVVKWLKPPDGWYKLNVDAALDNNNSKMGFGFVLRDSNGLFKATGMIPWQGLHGPDEAEAIGIREALKWLKLQSLDRICIESDCAKVIHVIQSISVVSYFNLILHDIQNLARDFSNLLFVC